MYNLYSSRTIVNIYLLIQAKPTTKREIKIERLKKFKEGEIKISLFLFLIS